MCWRLCLCVLLTVFAGAAKDDQMPPRITSIFNNEYFYPRDSILTDAVLKCRAINGQIQLVYEWNKDGVIVRNSQFVSINNSSGILKFVKLLSDDYGMYQCSATNNFGISISKPFKVKESRLGSFPPSQIQEVHCKEYEHCKVECRDKPICFPDSKCRVEWKIGEGTQTNVEINKRIGVDQNGDLHFLWTDLNDWTGQQYRCGLWHEQLKRFVVGSETRLIIQNTTAVPEKAPLLVSKEDGKAMVGGNGVLRCMFSGKPAPDIEWISPQTMFITNTTNKYDITDFGRVLIVLKAEQENEGYYTCKGKGNTISGPQRVFLNVTSPPFLTGDNQMVDVMVTEGNEASFRCEAASLSNEMPPTPPLWKKNGKDLDVNGVKYIVRENSRVLTVTDVQKGRDTGVYQCMSENSEGVLLNEAILKVIDPITIRERPLSSYKILPGDVLNLAVVADTDPSLTLQYKWMFTDHEGNEKEIETNDHWNISRPIRNSLTIDLRHITNSSILFSLTGYYSVKIYHSYDQKKIHFTVETDTITMPTDPITTTGVLEKAIDEHTYPDIIIYIVVSVETFIIIIEIIIIVSYLLRKEQGRIISRDRKEITAISNTETEL